MQLTEHPNEHQLFVRRADADRIVVIDRTFERSLILSAERVVEDFPARTVAEIDDAAVARVLQLEPELVLLGSGKRVDFPAAAISAQFLGRGVGLETMDNAAAARTFNVLTGEGRRAVAVFLLPG